MDNKYEKFFEGLINLCNKERVFVVVGQIGTQSETTELGGFYLRKIDALPKDTVILLPYFEVKKEIKDEENK